MFLLKKILSALLLPPFGLILLAALGVLLMGRFRKVGRSLALLALALLAAVSLPWVADRLQGSLEAYPPLSPARYGEIEAIVVLGGGSYHDAPEFGGATTVSRYSLQRLRYAARLQRQTGKPLLVTGGTPFGGIPEGEAMRASLQTDFAVPVRWVETASRDTAENASLSAPLLQAAGVRRIALVSDAWHLRRAVPPFAALGFDVLPAPTGFATGSPSLLEEWLPNGNALERSAMACKEWLGITVQAAKTGL